MVPSRLLFLSTLSLRRATTVAGSCRKGDIDFYPRSPCGERRLYRPICVQQHYFYPRSPCGERPWYGTASMFILSFLSTLSLRRATYTAIVLAPPIPISIHALLAESDTSQVPTWFGMPNFYPRSPCGERLPAPTLCPSRGQFLSTLSLRRATVLDALSSDASTFLSTLSLRRATSLARYHAVGVLFLSTLSLRRATTSALVACAAFKISIHALLAESDSLSPLVSAATNDFYPRSPCGERPGLHNGQFVALCISIHALLAESDSKPVRLFTNTTIFLSTLSLRRATLRRWIANSQMPDFYPRSPCGERPWTARQWISRDDFYPRSPCGERPLYTDSVPPASRFLSTLSLRRATVDGGVINRGVKISIHALLAESDVTIVPACGANANFYPRSPCGERHTVSGQSETGDPISIHALLAESDTTNNSKIDGFSNFYPRSPCGERLKEVEKLSRVTVISIHALLAESDLRS